MAVRKCLKSLHVIEWVTNVLFTGNPLPTSQMFNKGRRNRTLNALGNRLKTLENAASTLIAQVHYYCRFSHHAESTYWCISELNSCLCSSIWSSIATTAEHIYVKMLWSWQSSHGRGLKSWIWIWDPEQLIRSIETSVFYRNASNYHLIDVLTLTDTQHGHMVFLTKLTE